MKLVLRRACVAGLLTMSAGVTTLASDPMGVYCIVDKVVLEPADAPARAQVWGTCALANTNDWYFQAPAKGYFYFQAPAGRETTARAEWADLKSVASTGQAVGFARRYQPVGRFRPETEKPVSPDTYPLHIGVLKVGARVVPEVQDVVDKIKTARGR